MLRVALKRACQYGLHGEAMSGKSAEEPTWRTCKRCEGGQCVQTGALGEAILVRSSDDQDGRYIALSLDTWQVFVAGVKDGNFDSL